MHRILGRAIPVLALLAAPALAQHDHDHGKPGPHGGRIAEAGTWHAELVVAGGSIRLYLSDGALSALPAAGFAGTAILVSEGKPLRIALAPDGDALAGALPTGFKGRPKGAIRLVGPGGATASAKFD